MDSFRGVREGVRKIDGGGRRREREGCKTGSGGEGDKCEGERVCEMKHQSWGKGGKGRKTRERGGVWKVEDRRGRGRMENWRW